MVPMVSYWDDECITGDCNETTNDRYDSHQVEQTICLVDRTFIHTITDNFLIQSCLQSICFIQLCSISATKIQRNILIYANTRTRFIKILKIIYLDYYPSRNFSWKYRHFPKKIDNKTFVHKVHKVHRLLSMDALPLLFSSITPYFWPLYSQLFGISHVLLWQFLKIKFRGYFVGGSIILYYMRTRAWDSKMCELCELCEQLTNTPIWGNCKYATTTIFFVLNCIFFGFRAFYLFLSKFLQ